MIDDITLWLKLESTIYMVSLLDFINSISQTDDIQDVNVQAVCGKVTY